MYHTEFISKTSKKITLHYNYITITLPLHYNYIILTNNNVSENFKLI